MALIKAEPEPIFVPHRVGQQALACSSSKYWGLVRSGKITVVGRRKGSRASWESIKRYAAELIAEAQSGKAA
jgi:hypothetical protein